jgi:two-component system phosphate regulon sensor histidine kinase PhoR
MLDLVLIALCLALGLVVWRLQLRLGVERAGQERQRAEERERHQAEEHALSARMQAMLDSMIEGILVLDVGGKIVRVNRAAESIFGFSRMMAGGTLLEAVRHHELAALAHRVTSQEAPIEQEIRIERPAARILQVSAVALRTAAGAPAGVVLVVHDVTRLRQLEAMRQEFVANVSHELRTPLSLIKSAAETLIDGGRNDPAVTARFLEIIDKHATRLTRLIDDLLLLSRLESDRVAITVVPVAVRTLAQEALDDVTLMAAGRDVTLANEVPEPLVARGDAEQLQHVFGNLLSNAIKYGRTGGHVTVTARPLGESAVEVAVRDDGPGIPVEAQGRVFERFYRVDKARSREQGGTGLGLSIVKHVVQAHGGEVRVESEPGHGAAFFFTLPCLPRS